jgi:hypothetical protein
MVFRSLLTCRWVDREVPLAALCCYGILVLLLANVFVLLDVVRRRFSACGYGNNDGNLPHRLQLGARPAH